MKFNVGLPFLAISAFVVTGGAWLIGTALGPTEDKASETPAAALSDVHRRDLAEDSRQPLLAETSTLEGNRRVVERAAWPVPDDSIWLEGRVVFPPDTPADEDLRVVAWGRRFPGEGNRITYEMAPDPDGRFRVAFSAGTRTGRLRLAARYLYLKHDLSLKLSELSDGIVLEPLVGGHLSVRVNLPPGVDPVELDRVEVYADLGRSADGEWPSSRQSAKHEDGMFELSGLPPGSDVQLRTMSQSLCDGQFSVESLQAGENREAKITLTHGVRLAGRVVAANGAAVIGARITIEREVELAIPSFMMIRPTDESGAFEILGAPPGRIALRATHSDHLDCVLNLGILANGAVVEDVLLRLGQGDDLEGIVQWPDGSPAIGARVEVRRETKNERFFVESAVPDAIAKTGTDGRFQLTGLRIERCTVRARSRPAVRKVEPYWHAVLEDVRPSNSPLVLVLQSGTAVEGRVVDDSGVPVERFTVKVKRGERMRRLRGYRDFSKKCYSADSQFRVEGVPAGSWTVTVTSRGYTTSRPVSVRVPQEGSLTIVTPREARVSGIVLDSEGLVIGGARIEAKRDDGNWEAGKTTKDWADENGRFELVLAPGKYEITASKSSHAETEPMAIEIGPGGQRRDLVLRLRSEGRITGVVDPSLGNVAGRLVLVAGLLKESDSQGHFAFDDLAPGIYEISVLPEFVGGHFVLNSILGSTSVRVELEEGQTRHVVLGGAPVDPIRVFGRVTGAGQPTGELILTFESQTINAYTEIGPAGSYEIVVDGAGHYDVMIGKTHVDRLYYEIEIPEGVGHLERDFELPSGRITGYLLGTDGDAIEGGLVTLEIGGDLRRHRSVSSDPDGSFRFDRLRPGNYTLRGDVGMRTIPGPAFNYGSTVLCNIEVDEGMRVEGLEIHLPLAATIKGTVLSPSGFPQAGVGILIMDSRGPTPTVQRWTETDSNGEYTCRGVGTGTFHIRGVYGEQVSDWRELTVPEGGTVSVDIVLDG